MTHIKNERESQWGDNGMKKNQNFYSADTVDMLKSYMVLDLLRPILINRES